MTTEPHAMRHGWLKNSNPPGDPTNAPRCGAKTRQGTPCQGLALHGKRSCRMPGGLSTGPRTPEGLARRRRANWNHGAYSREAREARQKLRWALDALCGRVR